MRILYMVVIGLLAAGCTNLQTARQPTMTVDALASPEFRTFHTYAIAPAHGMSPGIEFDQYAAQVQRIMDARGYTRIPDMANADAGVFLSVKVGSPQTHTSTSVVPMWGQTGYSSAYTSASAYGNSYQANTTYTPRYGITGYVPYSSSITTYPIGFMIEAVMRTNDERKVETIWKLTAATTSSSPDVRSVFPSMLMNAARFIGADTGGMVSVPIF